MSQSSRTVHKAAALLVAQERERDRLLSTELGRRVLEHSDGDVLHAARIVDELERRRGRPEPADVIRLPRLHPDDWLAEDELELDDPPRPPLTLAAWSWRSVAVFAGVGVAGWIVLAAIAFAVYELVGWLR